MVGSQDLIGIQGFHVFVEYDFWLLAGLFKSVGTASCRGETCEREQSLRNWRDCWRWSREGFSRSVIRPAMQASADKLKKSCMFVICAWFTLVKLVMSSFLDRFYCQVSKLYSATDHLAQAWSDSRGNNHVVPVNHMHLQQVKTSARPCIYFHRSYPFN